MAKYCTRCGRPLDACVCAEPESPLSARPEPERPIEPQWPPIPPVDREAWPPKIHDSERVGADRFGAAAFQRPPSHATFTPQSIWRAAAKRMGLDDPLRGESDGDDRGRAIVPDLVRPVEGEIPVKQYEVAILRSRFPYQRAACRLQVTNKRLIFHASGRAIAGRTMLQSECALDAIAGVSCRRFFRFSWRSFAVTLLLAAVPAFFAGTLVAYCHAREPIAGAVAAAAIGVGSAIPFFWLHKKFSVKAWISSLGLGAIAAFAYASQMHPVASAGLLALPTTLTLTAAALASFVPNLSIAIQNRETLNAIVIQGEGAAPRRNGILTGFADVLPTAETENAIQEIGAMIADLQKRGDGAIETWRVENVQPMAGWQTAKEVIRDEVL